MKNRKPLFSLLPGRDLIFKASTGSGPGGQHRNKTESTITLTHPASGVSVRAGDEKSQHRNKRIALRRLVQNRRFKSWVRLHSAMIAEGYNSLEDKVDKLMKGENIIVEYIYKFTCDKCKKSVKVVSKKAKEAPPGWIEKDGTHLCASCQSSE